MDAQFKSVRQNNRYNSRRCLVLQNGRMALTGHLCPSGQI
jgi:hypothetical protein